MVATALCPVGLPAHDLKTAGPLNDSTKIPNLSEQSEASNYYSKAYWTKSSTRNTNILK